MDDKNTGEGLGESCRHIGKKACGRIRPTNDMVMRTQQANAVKTSMRPGNTSDIVFLNELKPSDVRMALFFHIRKIDSSGLYCSITTLCQVHQAGFPYCYMREGLPKPLCVTYGPHYRRR